LRRELARIHLLLRDFLAAEETMAPGLQNVKMGLAMVGEDRDKKGSVLKCVPAIEIIMLFIFVSLGASSFSTAFNVETIQENVADLLVVAEICHNSYQFQRALENLEPARELQLSLLSHLRSINAPTTPSNFSLLGKPTQIGTSESSSYDYLSGVSAECTLAHIYYMMGNEYMQLDDAERSAQMFSDALAQYSTHEVCSCVFNFIIIFFSHRKRYSTSED
jgi:hypothetical protein